MKGTIQRHDNGTSTLTNIEGYPGQNYSSENIEVHDIEKITESEMIEFFKSHPFTDSDIIKMMKEYMRHLPNVAYSRVKNSEVNFNDIVRFKVTDISDRFDLD